MLFLLKVSKTSTSRSHGFETVRLSAVTGFQRDTRRTGRYRPRPRFVIVVGKHPVSLPSRTSRAGRESFRATYGGGVQWCRQNGCGLRPATHAMFALPILCRSGWSEVGQKGAPCWSPFRQPSLRCDNDFFGSFPSQEFKGPRPATLASLAAAAFAVILEPILHQFARRTFRAVL